MQKKEQPPADKSAPFVADAMMALMASIACHTVAGMVAWRIYWRIHGFERNGKPCYVKAVTLATEMDVPIRTFWHAGDHGVQNRKFAHSGTARSPCARHWHTVMRIDGFDKNGAPKLSFRVVRNTTTNGKTGTVGKPATENECAPSGTELCPVRHTSVPPEAHPYKEVGIKEADLGNQNKNVVLRETPLQVPCSHKMGKGEQEQGERLPTAESLVESLKKSINGKPEALLEEYGVILFSLACRAAYPDPLNASSAESVAVNSLGAGGCRRALDATFRFFPAGHGSWKSLPDCCAKLLARLEDRFFLKTGEKPSMASCPPLAGSGQLVAQLLSLAGSRLVGAPCADKDGEARQ